MADKIVELSRGVVISRRYGDCKTLVEADDVNGNGEGGVQMSYARPKRLGAVVRDSFSDLRRRFVPVR